MYLYKIALTYTVGANGQNRLEKNEVQHVNELTEEEIATAYHEAGHAVIALAFGRSIVKISIVRNTLRLGQVQIGNSRNRTANDFLDQEVMILLAGLASEARYTGFYNWAGADQDLMAVKRIVRNRVATEKQMDRLQQRLLDKTEYSLDLPGHWEAVEKIVQQLIQHRSISGRAARHIFEECID